MEPASEGLFVSVLQEPPVLSSRQAILELLQFAKKNHIRILFVQVYRANKAWFFSKHADTTPYFDCLHRVGEDPLAFLIEEAHQEGIQVHAWINLLSLSANENAPILKKYGTAVLTRNQEEKKSIQDFKVDNQYFLEPGDLRVQDTLSQIVGELVRGYPTLDGVQLDYIRYPDVRPDYGYTQANINRFKNTVVSGKVSKENPSWKQWKYDQVTGLVRRLVKKAKSINPQIQVSTTGLMPYYRASLESFQDWRLWLKTGLVDFVTLMTYADDLPEFYSYLKNASEKAPDLKKVYIGLGAYKLRKTPEVFQEQVSVCQEAGARGCVVLDYADLIQYNMKIHD